MLQICCSHEKFCFYKTFHCSDMARWQVARGLAYNSGNTVQRRPLFASVRNYPLIQCRTQCFIQRPMYRYQTAIEGVQTYVELTH